MASHLGTSRIARMLGMSPTTVAALIDSGELRGHRIGKSQYRRVTIEEVRRYAKANGIPVKEEEAAAAAAKGGAP